MNELTKAEEQIMRVLWEKEGPDKVFVKDILAELPPNKKGKQPSYTTVATVMTVLEKKEFVKCTKFGNLNQYSSLVSKSEYSDFLTKNVVKKYFGGSLKSLVSFFVEKNEVDVNELDDILKLLEKKTED